MDNSSSYFVKSSLYVGDLHPDVTEAVLYRIFSPIGNVASIRLMRDVSTKKSLCYAYVNFHSPQEAEAALDTINYELVFGKPIRIMWCHRDPSTRKKTESNIVIKNLDPEIDTKTLHDAFSIFGSIYSCKICYAENGISKGYGFVHFEKISDARRAVEKMDGFQMGERNIYVGKFVPRTSMFLDSNKNLNDQERKEIICRGKNFNNLYVKNFPKEYSDEDFLNLFHEFGSIVSAKVMRKYNGQSKGFGFVCYENGYASKNAIKELNSKQLEGQKKPLVVTYAEKKTERVQKLKKLYACEANHDKNKQKTNIYVKNLFDDIDEDKLLKLFGPFGPIDSCILIKKNDKPTGAALINYSKPEHASQAIEGLNGKLVVNKPLFVAYAQTKEERKQILDDIFQKSRQIQYNNTPMIDMAQSQLSQFDNFPPILSNHHYINQKPILPTYENNNNMEPRPFSFPRLLGIIRPTVAIPIAQVNQIIKSDSMQCIGNYSPPSSSNSMYAQPKVFSYQNSNFNRSNGNYNIRNQQQNHNYHRVHQKVQKINYKWAPKVTKMLLELESPILNDLLSSDNNFSDKVNEFVQLLEN